MTQPNVDSVPLWSKKGDGSDIGAEALLFDGTYSLCQLTLWGGDLVDIIQYKRSRLIPHKHVLRKT